MADFMLLLHDNPAVFAKLSAEEIQRVIQEYGAWADAMRKENRLVGGNKLKDEGGRHVTRRDGKLHVVDGPYVEAKEVLGGYFILKAADYAEAVRLSESCPHLKYNGRIEVREVDYVG
jgi:hypothetical protein